MEIVEDKILILKDLKTQKDIVHEYNAKDKKSALIIGKNTKFIFSRLF